MPADVMPWEMPAQNAPDIMPWEMGKNATAQPAEQPSMLPDAAQSLAGGIEKGAVALPMVLPNLINQVFAGPQLLGRGIADTIEGNPTDKNFQPWKPFYDSSDVINELPDDIQPHTPQTMAGVGADIVGQLAGNVAAGKGIQNVAEKLTAPETPSPQEIKKASQNAYKQMAQNGAVLNQNGMQKVTNSINNALSNSGLMNEGLHGDTMSIVKDLNDDAANGTMSLEKLDQYRQLLNQAVTKNTSKIEGANPDAYKSNVAINALDSAVDSLSGQDLSSGTPQAVDSLNNARALYSAAAKMSDVQRIINNAQNTDNPATAIRTGFRTLARHVNVSPRGYTPDEVDAINHAAKTGVITGALKIMGSRLMSGIAGTTAGAVGGGALGAPLGLIAGEAVGVPMRAAANALQAARGQKVIDLIGNRPNVQAALGNTPLPPLPSLTAPVAASINATSIPQNQRATGSIGDENMQELQKLQFPNQSNSTPLKPQSNAAPIEQYLGATREAESGGNNAAHNPNSTASGAFQFTDRTWAQMVGKYGKQTGITLGDKNNPQAQATMARLLAQDNIQTLHSELGRYPTMGELYQAHVFGAGGAAKLIKATAQMPNRPAITVFPPDVVSANKPLFFNGAQPRTVQQLSQLLASKV